MAQRKSTGEGRYAYGRVVKEAIKAEKPVQVTLMDGDMYYGVLCREDRYTVTVDTGTRLVVLYKNQISRIAFAPEPDLPRFPG